MEEDNGTKIVQGKKILRPMNKQYGNLQVAEAQVFYATKNKGKIKGVKKA